jgi:hypothetical protein
LPAAIVNDGPTWSLERDMTTEEEESSLLGAVNKEGPVETITDILSVYYNDFLSV